MVGKVSPCFLIKHFETSIRLFGMAWQRIISSKLRNIANDLKYDKIETHVARENPISVLASTPSNFIVPFFDVTIKVFRLRQYYVNDFSIFANVSGKRSKVIKFKVL